MSHLHIDAGALRATIEKMGELFFTRDVSEHPDMLRAHAELAGERNYHAWVGRAISDLVPEVTKTERHNKRRGQQWARAGRRGERLTGDSGGAATESTPAARATSPAGTHPDLGPQYSGDDAFARRMRLHQSWYRAYVLGTPCGTGPMESSSSHYGNMLTPADGRRGQARGAGGVPAD